MLKFMYMGGVVLKILDDKRRKEKYIEKYSIKDILPEDIINQLQLVKYDSGENILQAEEKLEKLYFFVEGKLKVYTFQENGRSLLLSFYTKFDSIGEVELFKDLKITNPVDAITDSYLLSIPVEVLKDKVMDYPPFLRYIIRTLTEKLNDLSTQSAFNLLYPLKNRLASFLWMHNTGKKEIILKDSFKEIAEYLGTTYRHLHRALKELEDEGLIRRNRRIISISNEKKLKELAGDIYK
ncbi:MAG TPA: cyclic nucleotide-binding protein [Clostridiales bacterium]|nr:cyclic nucleotide-binding protein [Clostridiales bacterium]